MIRALSRKSRFLVAQATDLRSTAVKKERCSFAARSSSAAAESTREEQQEPASKRQQFKQINFHPSILEYIRSIGVGIPPRGRKAKMARGPVGNRRYRRSVLVDSGYPSENSKLGRPPNTKQQQKKNKSQKVADNSRDQKEEAADAAKSLPRDWMPPPPFGKNKGTSPVQVVGRVEFTGGPRKHKDNDDIYIFPKNKSETPEIALAGRSNVGKSTLLNALLYGNRENENILEQHSSRRRGRGTTVGSAKLPKGVKAVMSTKPGETRSITFYQLQHVGTDGTTTTTSKEPVTVTRRLQLVDLPGYGFAYAKESDAERFCQFMTDYILNRGSKRLKRLLILIDARHGMKPKDFEFLEMLQQKQQQEESSSTKTKQKRHAPKLPPIQLVLTKCDLVSQTDLARRVAQVRQQLSDAFRREPSQLPVMMVSARAGVGYNNVDQQTHRAQGGVLELQKELAALATPRRRQLTNKEKDNDEEHDKETGTL